MLGSIYTVPAFLKAIFEGRDPNTGLARKCAIFILNFGAFLIQVWSIVLCEMFQVSMTPSEKLTVRNIVVQEKVAVVVPRPELGEGYFRNEVLFELPVAVLLISLSYWENYVEGEFFIFGKTMNFKAWKKHLHHARGRLYIFASVWKTVWVVAFAVLLQTGFNFNLRYSQPLAANDTGVSQLKSQTKDTSTITSASFAKRDVKDNAVNVNVTPRNGVSRTEPKTFLILKDNADELKTKPNANESNVRQDVFYFSPETMQHFEEYGVLYLQIISSTLLAYFGSTACKLCMQLLGFSLPLSLTTPLSIAVVVLQNMFEFLPTGSFVWIGMETEGNKWILHLAWLGVLWLSELFITSHIWFPGNGRMEKIDR